MRVSPILHRFKLWRRTAVGANCRWYAMRAALGVVVVIAAIPGFINPGFAQTRPITTSHIYNDPDAKVYSRTALPRSTAPISGLTQSKSEDLLQQLDRIERQSVTAFKSTSELQKGNNLRQPAAPNPAFSRASEKQLPIDFTYHVPHPGRSAR